MRYDLNYTELEIRDLYEDFYLNETFDLYEFIDGDVNTAFYLGANISDWLQDLPKEKQYLYTKQARHNFEYISDYNEQYEYWYKKAIDTLSNKDHEVDLIEVSNYILNNLILEDESLIINFAFLLGNVVYKSQKKDVEFIPEKSN